MLPNFFSLFLSLPPFAPFPCSSGTEARKEQPYRKYLTSLPAACLDSAQTGSGEKEQKRKRRHLVEASRVENVIPSSEPFREGEKAPFGN